jgi:hypothetical protein
MWLLGAVILFVFYKFSFKWYFRFYFYKNPLQRPMMWRSKRIHLGVLLIASVMLFAAGFCFYQSKPSLVVVPILFVPAAFVFYISGRGVRLVKIVHLAVRIQVEMEKDGVPQAEINRVIALKTIEDTDPVSLDFSFDAFLKFCVISREGLLPPDYEFDLYMTTLRQIDEEILKAKKAIQTHDSTVAP